MLYGKPDPHNFTRSGTELQLKFLDQDLDPAYKVKDSSVVEAKRAKITQKNRKRLINFIFRSVGCSFLRAEGFS